VLAGWRWTLVVYSLVSLGLVAPWLLQRHAVAAAPERAPLPLRVPLAWAIAGVFALQSILFYGFNAWLADAYVERGWSDTRAGGLAAMMNGVALVLGIATALTAERLGSRRSFLLAGSGASVAAASLIAADVGGAWGWAGLLGVGIGVLFTTVMTLPLDAADDRAEIAAYSTVMLGVGYAISSLAPTALGAVRDATGTFTAPLAILAVDALLLLAMSARVATQPGRAAGRPRPAQTP
jgi:MFS transporter, CP family, cyanate transporter